MQEDLVCDGERRGCWVWRSSDPQRPPLTEHHVEDCPVRVKAEAAPDGEFRPNTMTHTAGRVAHGARTVWRNPRPASRLRLERSPVLALPSWWPTDIVYATTRRGKHLVAWTPEAMDPEALLRAWEYGTDRSRVLGDVMMDRVQEHLGALR